MPSEQISVIYAAEYRVSILKFLELQKDVPIEIVELSGEESREEISSYFNETGSEYIYIYEEGYVYAVEMLKELVKFLDVHKNVDMAVSPRSFLNSENHIIARPYGTLYDNIYGRIYDGESVVSTMKYTHINMVGG